MQPKLPTLAMTICVIAFSLVPCLSFSQTTNTATVSTDKLDYSPGATVFITGSGFAPGETIALQVEHTGTDPLGTDPQYHQPWNTTANGDGSFSSTWTVPTDGDAYGASYVLTADGQTSLSHAQTYFSDGSTVNQWADATVPPGWKNTLNTGDATYFQGEVTPFVYDVNNLIAGHSYTVSVTFDYFHASKNAGGFAYMTTYNVSRSPSPFTTGSTPIADNSYAGTAINGVFYTYNADITNVTAPSDVTTGSVTTRTISITFTASGTTADIYWGMFLSKTGTVSDYGTAPTEGAGSWPGGSLQVVTSADIDGTTVTSNTSTNPGKNIFQGLISGMKYLDVNKDGTKQNSENGLANWVIYLDQNDNNVLDAGEVSTTTDVNGNYSFADIFPNTYIVREQNQSNYTETQPGNTLATNKYTVVITSLAPQSTGNVFGNFTCTTPKPTISTTTSTTFCDGGSVVLTSSATSGNQWNKDGTAISGATSTTYTATTGGSYTVTATLYDCPNTSLATVVVVNPLPVPGITGSGSACTGSTGNVYSTESGMTNYVWNVTGGSITSGGGSSDNSVTVTWGASGTGHVTVNYTNSNSCTAASATDKAVTVNALPIVTGTLSVCAGSTTQLSGDGTAATLTPWVSDATGTATVSNTGLVTGVAAGTAHITYTNSNGCSATVTVTVNALPIVTGTLSVCAGSTTQLSGNGTAATLTPWVSDATGTATVSNTGLVTGVAAGTAHITYTNSNGCSATVTVTVNGRPVPTITGSATVCADHTGYIYSTESGMSNYVWNVTGGTTTSGGGASDNSITITWGAAGTGHVTVNYTNGNGCTASSATDKTVTIVANGTLTRTSATGTDAQTVCLNSSITDITYSVGGTSTTASLTGTLPNGVTGSYNSSTKVFTITGQPTQAGTFNYTINTSGSTCTNPSTTGSITVTPTSICPSYNGDYFFNTGSTTSGGTATFPLSYTITGTGTCNDISLLTLSDLSISSSADPSSTGVVISNKAYNSITHTLTANVTVTLGSNVYSAEIQFSVTAANGNYTVANACADPQIVTVSTKVDGFVTGGGFVLQTNTDGSKGGTPNEGLKNNFGFNIKYNKSGSNLQGNWNSIFRRNESGVIHNYQIKSAQASKLTVGQVSATSYRADFTFTGVNLKDLTSSSATIGSNLVLTVSIFDNGEPGSGVDQIYYDLKDVSGTPLWYKTNKTGAVMLLTKGNIQIHMLGSKAAATTSRDIQAPTNIAQDVELKAIPNPSHSYFTLQLCNQGSGAINLRVTDILGRIVEARQNLVPGQTLKVGSNYEPGIYIAEVKQGNTVKQIKLIKQ